MPTPARTSLDEIVTVGRGLVESEGLDGLTMHKVAAAVGIRAPSLYKHVAGRAELLRLIVEDVVRNLGETLDAAIDGENPRGDLEALVHAFRQFAHDHPEAYRLVFAPMADEWRPERDLLVAASEPVFRTTAALAGPESALAAARMVTAWAHGFMSMELAGAFRIGGDLDEAFDYGVERMLIALTTG